MCDTPDPSRAVDLVTVLCVECRAGVTVNCRIVFVHSVAAGAPRASDGVLGNVRSRWSGRAGRTWQPASFVHELFPVK